ncbi:MAG: CPCC family cysteine-rich protein [Oscillospiraceae bacterium]
MWEIDLFIHDDNEASDLNSGLSLKKAKENYKQFGAVLQNLKQYCREPKEHE